MIKRQVVEQIDRVIDQRTSQLYRDQPTAQDWARVSKIIEELGEAIAELISWTGQNYRKGANILGYDRMLDELADTGLTAIYAIQHFTKDIRTTALVLDKAAIRHMERAEAAA